MKRTTVLLALSLPFWVNLAWPSGDGCDQWCGQLPNAYFLAPLNDSRGNVGLLLEDLGIVAYQPKSIPFHYGEFLSEEGQAVAQEAKSPVTELAVGAGLGAELAAAALERVGTEHYGRCMTDDAPAIEAFLNEIKASSLAPEDRKLLSQERLRFAGLCEKSLEAYQPLAVSEAAKPYARYLEGAAAFYSGAYERALEQFKSLAADGHPWLRETALYLQARVALNQAQVHFDDLSAPSAENVDRAFLARASAVFDEYLKAYPAGRYAPSAKGLFRKIHWLSGDQAALTRDYQAWLGNMSGAGDWRRSALQFIDETESKLNPAVGATEALWTAPMLAGVNILAAWRETGDGGQSAGPVDKAVIAAHRPQFSEARLESLGPYLELAHAFWVGKDFAGVIRDTASDRVAEKASNQIFSRWVLRGLALLASQQFQEAENLFQSMAKTIAHPGQKRQAQWLLALTWKESGQLDKLYAAQSPLAGNEVQDYFIHAAGPALLEALLPRADLSIRVRSLAYYSLVNERLRHRDLPGAERILSAVSPAQFTLANEALAPLSWPGQKEGYTCPPLKNLLGQLQKTPNSARALNCLGDFLRTQSWDSPAGIVADEPYREEGADRWRSVEDYGLPARAKPDRGFGSKVYTSLDYYQEVIAQKGGGEDVAYALHRATNCFASSGYNHCGGQDIPKPVRAAWFKRLKSEYKKSAWAQEQKYFW